MDLNICRKPIELSPQLEALRAKGLQECSSETNDWIFQLIKRTSRIHAGFLFEDRKTLQNLCILLDETQNKITDAGWEAFGYHLGLNSSILRVINHNNFNKEDPCYNVLLAYVQYENASVGKILEALFKIKRFDVLTRIRESISDLTDLILQCQCNNTISSSNSVEDTSDYDSLPTLEGSNPNIDSNISNSSNEVLIRPKVIPTAPFIFQNIQTNPDLTSRRIQQALNTVLSSELLINSDDEKYNNNTFIPFNKITCANNLIEDNKIQVLKESIQTSAFIKKEQKSSKTKKYGLKIFLTFAEDGEKYVQEICKCFRKKRSNYPSVGVLVLSEHIEQVNKDPPQFINGAFHQVDYVCPVLTIGYYNLITKKQKGSSLSTMHVDACYVPYIYRLMNSYFTSNDCLNDKVRCIIPDNLLTSAPLNFLLKTPIFGAWIKLSEIEELVERLLKGALKNSYENNSFNI